jgi:hypothetical protein
MSALTRPGLPDTWRVAAYDPALVLQVLAFVVPLSLAGAVSPVMLIVQTVILAGPDGKRAGTRHAAGEPLTLLLFVSVLLLFGRAISLPEEPRLDATLDIVIGALLVVFAVAIRWRRPRHRSAHRARREKPPGRHWASASSRWPRTSRRLRSPSPPQKRSPRATSTWLCPVVAVLVAPANRQTSPLLPQRARIPSTAAFALQTGHFRGPPEGAVIAIMDPSVIAIMDPC